MSDETFYGSIPPNMTRNEAVNFLAKGISNYMKAQSTETSREHAISILDSWMEHDSNRNEPKFDHLFEDEDGEVETDCLETIVEEAFKITGFSRKRANE